MAHNFKEHWPEKKKIEAVTTYLALGKFPFVAQVTGIPLETLRTWKKQEWWSDLESQIRTEENQELDTKLSKIVNKSLDVVVDRLENGEFYMDKTGKVHRVPVKLKDATKVTSDLLDRRSLIRKEPARQLAEKQESVNERLLSLAEQFAAIALGKDPRKAEKIIEGEIIDAIPEERKEGLQQGTFLGTQEETESCEGQSCQEQGEEYDDTETRQEGSSGEGYRSQESNISWWTESTLQPDSTGTK